MKFIHQSLGGYYETQFKEKCYHFNKIVVNGFTANVASGDNTYISVLGKE